MTPARKESTMNISQWLDQKESQGFDVSRAVLPEELEREEEPDETLYFKEVRPCSVLCTGDHPFATVERFGRWYRSRGREKEKGPHTGKPPWWFFTRDRDLAVQMAKSRIEK
jgi:hypothetical protein